jgi:hypothetical protein
MAKYPQKLPLKVQIPHIHFASQVTHLEEPTKTNHPLNRTLVRIGVNFLSIAEFQNTKKFKVKWPIKSIAS